MNYAPQKSLPAGALVSISMLDLVFVYLPFDDPQRRVSFFRRKDVFLVTAS